MKIVKDMMMFGQVLGCLDVMIKFLDENLTAGSANYIREVHRDFSKFVDEYTKREEERVCKNDNKD